VRMRRCVKSNVRTSRWFLAALVVSCGFAVLPAGAQNYTFKVLSTLDPANGQLNPTAGVTLDAAGNVYGTTAGQNVNGYGGVFKITPSGAYSNLFLFSAYNLGQSANGVVVDASGNIFGTTQNGGLWNQGEVFEIKKDGTFNDLVDFEIGNGANPSARLTLDAGGNLYGTASNGGESSFNAGQIFKIDSTGNFNPLYSFYGGDGQNPTSPVTLDASGNIYGTTYNGGSGGGGVVYEINPNATVFTTLYSFDAGGLTGSNPQSGVVIDASGNLYGTTSQGGQYGYGDIYKISGGSLSVLHSFTSTDGYGDGGVIIDGSGNLFGTTVGNYPSSAGIVYEYSASGKFTTIETFDLPTTGGYTSADLAMDAQGDLYDTTPQGGAAGVGTVFELKVATPEPGPAIFGATLTLAGCAFRKRRKRKS